MRDSQQQFLYHVTVTFDTELDKKNFIIYCQNTMVYILLTDFFNLVYYKLFADFYFHNHYSVDL